MKRKKRKPKKQKIPTDGKNILKKISKLNVYQKRIQGEE